MKVKFDQVENGITSVTLIFSWADIVSNSLEDCFSMNTIPNPTLIKKGKFNNFINNYLVNEFYLKNNRFSNIHSSPMRFSVIGDPDKFVVVFIKMGNGGDVPIKDRDEFFDDVRENAYIDITANDPVEWENLRSAY